MTIHVKIFLASVDEKGEYSYRHSIEMRRESWELQQYDFDKLIGDSIEYIEGEITRRQRHAKAD